MSPRRSLLAILGLLTVLGVIAIAILLYTFDLNRYRSELAQGLGSAVNRPVRIGEAHLSLRHGLAFDFTDLHIGPSPDGSDELSAAHLFIKIGLLPLLKRQIAVREIVVDAPRLTLTLEPAAPGEPTAPLLIDRGLLEATMVRSLRVENGTLNLLDRRQPERPLAIKAKHIRGELNDLSLNRPGRLALTADLIQEGGPAAVNLSGEIAPPEQVASWRQARLDLDLRLQHLDPQPLLRRYASAANIGTDGRLALQLKLAGSPEAGLRLAGELVGADLALHLPDLYRKPLPLSKIQIDGTWTATAGTHRLSDLLLEINGMAFNGNLSLRDRQGQSWLEGDLSSSALPLTDLARFVPDRKSSTGSYVRESLAGGTLQIGSIRFAGAPEHFSRFDENFPLREATASVQGGAFRLDQQGTITGVAFKAAWKETRLLLTEGKGRLLEAPFEFSGSLAGLLQGIPEVGLEAHGTVLSENLMALVPAKKRPGISADGPLPLDLKITGPLDRLVLDLQADLKYVSGRLDQKLNKPAGLDGNIFLTGEITPERLELSFGRLSIPPLELRARGVLQREEDKNFSLSLDVAPLDLEKARFRTPLLERFAPRGELALHYEVDGSSGDIRHRQGTVSLRDFGFDLAGPVADIRGANGEILLFANRAQTSRLTARLGTSLVEIDGVLENFASPRLELAVRGKAIRADELIFPSDRAVLHDVDGHLVITRDGIDFSPVKVRLDGGTQATVQGALRNFRAPETTLEIDAEYGDIDEVIGLWQKPPPPPAVRVKTKRGRGALFIKARARKGTLGPLHFTDAEAEITLEQGVLNIFPLHFSAGSGHCTGRVAVDGTEGPPSLLKISGHLENIDAAALHHELLKKRGLVTGTLSGDFYLEGRAGKDFLATSLGGFDLKVKDGVLLKFKFLSKVFSLLNISQILTLRLPDMDQKGMPFERLTGTFSLRHGVLSTEDLFVKSNAMNLSLVGDADLAKEEVDLVLGVKPLRTVDKIITQIPIAGWLLTGEEKALITAHFQIKGKGDDPDVVPIPITSVSEKALGIFKRILELPGKVIEDMGEMLEGEQEK
jgi:hypothetical protein